MRAWLSDFLCRVGLHRYERVKDTGVNVYTVCRRCGKRDVYSLYDGAHQPIDHKWIETGRWSDRDWSSVDVSGIRSAAQSPNPNVVVVRFDGPDDGSV